MNNFPLNIFYILLLLEKYHQNCQVVFGCYRHERVNSFITTAEKGPDFFGGTFIIEEYLGIYLKERRLFHRPE